MRKITFVLLLLSTSIIANEQVLTSEINVDVQYEDQTEILNDLKVHGDVEANSISTSSLTTGSLNASGDLNTTAQIRASGNINTSGEIIAIGDVHTNQKVYFGGEDKSSYIMHFDGSTGTSSPGTIDISTKSSAFVNIKVSVGGRVNWYQVAAESNIFGYMYPNNNSGMQQIGYLRQRNIFTDGYISISYKWINAATVRIEINNSSPHNGTLMYAGTITVAQHGYGF